MCIPLHNRCNGNIDCDDRSDEFCKILATNLEHSSSIVNMPPLPKTSINFTMTLVRVQNVLVEENIIRAWIQVPYFLFYVALDF